MKLKRSILTISSLLLILTVCGGSLFADNFPRMIPDPRIAEAGLIPGPLPQRAMIETAVIISGAHPTEVSDVADEIFTLLEDAESSLDRDADPGALAEEILQFLHERVFRLYDEYQTRIDVVMRNGSFNCVSSAVLYMIVARHFDISIKGVGTVDHAFCAVVLQDRTVDVETTTVHGFDPGKKKEFQDSFGNVTGYSYVPPSDYSGRKSLSERELLALILQNRISVLENQKKYDAAVELAVDRYALAPGATSRDHLFREMGNYAALLNERREYQKAIDFLTRAVDRYGFEESIRGIHEILYHNVVVGLLQDRKPREAIAVVDSALEEGWMSVDAAANLRGQAAERILADELPRLQPENGLLLVDELRNEGLLSDSRHLEFALMFYSRLAEEQAGKKSYLEAAALIDTAITELGSDSRLVRAREAYRYNYTVEIHNEFAAMFNAQKYQEASQHVLKALEKVPESDMLRNDLETVTKAISESN